MTTPKPALIAAIESRILFVRGERVMLDCDLATLYGVPTKALNQAVKRNLERFPEDFMFQLGAAETNSLAALRSQFVTTKQSSRRAPTCNVSVRSAPSCLPKGPRRG
jgi:hypothetical protein